MKIYQMWYAASKTLAEEAAWKFQKENGIDMVVLNPGFVIGPLLQPTLNITTEVFFNHTTGTFPQIHPLHWVVYSACLLNGSF